jgi:hypothetical protein
LVLRLGVRPGLGEATLQETSKLDIDISILWCHPHEATVWGRLNDMQFGLDPCGTKSTMHAHGIRQEEVSGSGTQEGHRETGREVGEERGEVRIGELVVPAIEFVYRQ